MRSFPIGVFSLFSGANLLLVSGRVGIIEIKDIDFVLPPTISFFQVRALSKGTAVSDLKIECVCRHHDLTGFT